jgi:hypothetical protein
MQKLLNETQLNYLRSNSLLTEQEIAYVVGDLVIAENPVTKETRLVGQASILQEYNRRILKG